jgi:glycosyltransferase involved in cell wall biosynthesis
LGSIDMGESDTLLRQTPTKILFVTPFSWLYGEALSLLQLVQSLDKDRYEPSVITTGDGPLVANLQEVGIPVQSIKMPFLSRKGRQAFDFAVSIIPVSLWLSNYISKNGFDLVYNNTLLNPYGALASYLSGVPCVWHVREVGRESSLRRSFIKLTAFLATRLVVVSKSVSELYTYEEREKLRVVYNGLDPEYFNPALFDTNAVRCELGIRPGQPVISIVGRLHASKHHDDLIVATKRLVEQWQDLMVLIVGDGPLEEEIKGMVAEMGLRDNCRFLGYREDVREVLAASDLMVLPSEHEAFGRAVAEAMLMELPVVATNVGGIPELLSPETGLLVPARCPDELGEAMRAILLDPMRGREMGLRGRKRAVELFALENYVENMKNIFDELVN